MAFERPNSLSELAKLGFEELSETIPKLERLVQMLGDKGRVALHPVSLSASPDRALDGLIRLAEQQPKLVAQILSKEQAGLRLARVIGASDGLTDFLVRHSSSLKIFLEVAALPSANDLAKAFEGIDLDNPEDARSQIRVIYRTQLLRIADWDLSNSDFRQNIKPVTAALSDLAGFSLEASLEIAYSELRSEARFSSEEVEQTKLAIIGMGKCGARELNYLSDVDVIFVVEGEHENVIEIGTRLATRAMRNIDSPATEPPLWQVDANLRPEGKSGALVRTLEAHLSYYEKWAENWEFQALLKARPIAGDKALGQRYMDSVPKMIWERGDRSGIVETVRRMRQRVLENIPSQDREYEIKLGRGGLRDVEFTVQLLQLVHGSNYEEVRAQDTLSALDALAQAGFIGRGDRDQFQHHYQTLRALEHRVQLSKLRRDHLLPKTDSERRRIARGLGGGLTLEQLDSLWDSTRSAVSELHDSVFYRPLLNAMANLGTQDVKLSDEEVSLRLEALGFVDPKGAISHITALTQGISRRATIQRTLLPILIRWLGEGVNPDRGLLTFRRLSESLGESHWFLRMLRDSSGAAERLMRVLSNSEFIAKMLEHIPESSEWFGDDTELKPKPIEEVQIATESILARHSSAQVATEAIRAIRRREVLRIAIGGVLGTNSIEEVAKGLTDVTDAYLLAMLAIAMREESESLESFEFCIVTMGRLGGRELGFGSDADAMLVYRSSNPDAQLKSEAIASGLMSAVKDQLLGFELDLDLRPEGKQGVRVRSLDSYQAYYERWADVWEYQALLRARPIGSSALSNDFALLIDKYRYPAELSAKQLTEIRRIKARVETERLPQGADSSRHLKLGRGSLSDVEWLVQVYQLRYANQNPNLRLLGTIDSLRACLEIGLISNDDYLILERAWRLASRARSGLVLATDKAIDSLPTDRRQLEALARILEYQPGNATALEEDYLSATRKARAVFERLFVK